MQKTVSTGFGINGSPGNKTGFGLNLMSSPQNYLQ